jgi:hypothetical protein
MTTCIRIKVKSSAEAWQWCHDCLKTGTWSVWIGYVSESHCTFEFKNDRDAGLFSLMFSEMINES